MHRSVHRSPYGPRTAIFGDDGTISVVDQPMSIGDSSLPALDNSQIALQNAVVSDPNPIVTYSRSDYDASAQGQIQTEQSYQDYAQRYAAANPQLVKPASDSTIADATKGILGVLTAGGQVANTAIQNETVASLLRSRGFPVPAARPVASSGPSATTLLLLLAGGAAAFWALSK
jgi:hypothetical protein